MERKINVTADDFGLSPGINESIADLYCRGALSRASLFANCNYTAHAIGLVRDKKLTLPVGLHFSLNCGSCCADPDAVPMLVNEKGQFRLNYPALMFNAMCPFRRRRFLAQVERELEAQIIRLQKSGIRINHLDGHRHVHMIPGIFDVVTRIAARYGITQIRIINESAHVTRRMLRSGIVAPAGIVKLILLKMFYRMNGKKSGLYFFSILHSCRIRPEMFDADMMNSLPLKFTGMEIMLHPGNAQRDRDLAESLNAEELPQIMSPLRIDEYRAALEIRKIMGESGIA